MVENGGRDTEVGYESSRCAWPCQRYSRSRSAMPRSICSRCSGRPVVPCGERDAAAASDTIGTRAQCCRIVGGGVCRGKGTRARQKVLLSVILAISTSQHTRAQREQGRAPATARC